MKTRVEAGTTKPTVAKVTEHLQREFDKACAPLSTEDYVAVLGEMSEFLEVALSAAGDDLLREEKERNAKGKKP